MKFRAQSDGGRRLLVIAAVFSLAISVATRYCFIAGADAHVIKKVMSHSPTGERQHLLSDGLHWVAPAASFRLLERVPRFPSQSHRFGLSQIVTSRIVSITGLPPPAEPGPSARALKNRFLAGVPCWGPASCPAMPAGDLGRGIMKKNFYVVAAIVSIGAPMLFAFPVEGRSRESVQGTVVEVHKQRVESPAYQFGSGNPSDAPLASRYYAYEVSIRVDCKTYVGRYTTPFNYLPSAFTARQPIQFRLTKHVMYFELPDGWDVELGIVRRFDSCTTGR